MRKSMLLGYARVSHVDDDLAPQIAALREAGCDDVLGETISAVRAHKPVLAAGLAQLVSGDTLVVYGLDRLCRGLHELMEICEGLEARQIGLISVLEDIDTSMPGGFFSFMKALQRFNEQGTVERRMARLRKDKEGAPGRPKAVSAQDEEALARAILAGDEKPADLARQFGISLATVYRRREAVLASGRG